MVIEVLQSFLKKKEKGCNEFSKRRFRLLGLNSSSGKLPKNQKALEVLESLAGRLGGWGWLLTNRGIVEAVERRSRIRIRLIAWHCCISLY